MADPILIDPWGSTLIEDYERLIKEFGLSTISSTQFPSPNRLMRRNIAFAGQDLGIIAECIKKKKKPPGAGGGCRFCELKKISGV
mgnify:CR=1 FL=1